jgi:hypothetical protein
VRLDHLLSRERDPPANRALRPAVALWVIPGSAAGGSRGARGELPGRARPGRHPRRRAPAGDGGRTAWPAGTPAGHRMRCPRGRSTEQARCPAQRRRTTDSVSSTSFLPLFSGSCPPSGRTAPRPGRPQGDPGWHLYNRRSSRKTSILPTLCRTSEHGQTVDALALGADEGRRRRRKVLGSCQQALSQDYPNGETPPWSYRETTSLLERWGAPGELKHLSTPRKGNRTRFRQ